MNVYAQTTNLRHVHRTRDYSLFKAIVLDLINSEAATVVRM